MKSARIVLLLAATPALLLAQGVDRTRPPQLPPPPALQLPPVQTARLPNGLEIAVVEKHEVPVVDVSVLIGAGSVRDPDDLPGLATFTAAALQEGAGRRNSLEIADEIGYLGARLFTGASYDAATASLHVPKRQIGRALDLLADVVLRPTFPDSEIARERDLRRSQILQQRDQPVAMANIAFAAIVYGAAHPYGRPLNGTEVSTAALSRDRIAQFYQAYYRPNNTRVLVVGDVTLSEAQALIAERFDAWAAGDVPAVVETPAPAPAARTIYLVDKPGAAQSVFRIGQVGVRRTTTDYFALTVLNTLLGGSFTSRLNQNLRETHGYTYGASSQFAMRRMAGPFLAASSVVTAKTDSSLIEFMKELRRIRDEAVGQPELAKAKAYITLGLPSEFETTAGAAAQFRDLLLYGLPLDYYTTYIPRIDAVTTEDVQRVAREYLDPDHLAIVVVGDRSRIASGLDALHEGPIVLRDLWGQAVP
ncbi:MAG TPA: pitrilysin family protein [Gemmatimonadales bacterium]|nr:pitrilysin family protein [Gemmatimonadales bacterium]